MNRPCCVEDCEVKSAEHKRVFTVAWDHGEIETEARFCCFHIEQLASGEKPFVDLKVIGVERA